MDQSRGQAVQNLLNLLQSRPAVPSALEQFKLGTAQADDKRGFSPISFIQPQAFSGFRKGLCWSVWF